MGPLSMGNYETASGAKEGECRCEWHRTPCVTYMSPWVTFLCLMWTDLQVLSNEAGDSGGRPAGDGEAAASFRAMIRSGARLY